MALLALTISFGLVPQSYAFAQDSNGIFLPFVSTNAEATGSPSPAPTDDPFQPQPTDNLDDVVVGIQQNGDNAFLIAGGKSTLSGTALYTHAEDNEETSESACVNTCAEAWPPLTVETADELVGTQAVAAGLGTVARADGTLQVTYEGWPLYFYAGDIQPEGTTVSEANGQGIDGLWWRAEIVGEAIEGPDTSQAVDRLFRSSVSVVTSFAETGSLEINQSSRAKWHSVELSGNYSQPVVIMQPLSYNGNQPVTIRVQNISATSFQFKIDEWAYLDGPHITENIHYMVVEAGVHTLPNSGGQKLQAGLADVNHNWSEVTFAQSFTAAPIVLSQIQSFNGGEQVLTRQRNGNRARFQLRLQEAEASDGTHSVETVGYIAMMPGQAYLGNQTVKVGRTGNKVTHQPYKINFGDDYSAPVFLAGLQTFDGPDTAGLRYKELTSNSATVFVEEERSQSEEIAHTTEVVGYIVIGENDTPPTPETPTPTPETPTPETPTPETPTPETPTPETPTPETPTVTPVPGTQVVFITESTRVRGALEKTGAKANVELKREGGTGAINVAIAKLGHTDTTKASAIPADYIIRDETGQVLNDSIPFKVGQMVQNITIEAVADEQPEVPETLRIQLQAGTGYTVRDADKEVTIRLRDDRAGITEESRFFFGQMGPENGAMTSATGWAVIRLSNDNNYGLVSLSFSGLTSVETASHVHYANPLSGPIVHSIPLGQVTDDRWAIRAAHQATTDQAMLDALLTGNLYINVHSMNYSGGEIRATMQLTEGSPEFTPPPPAPPIEDLAGDELKRDITRFLSQATFGPTVDSVADMEARIASHGGDRIKAYEEWIDEQVTLQSPSMLEFFHANLQSYTANNGGNVTQQSRNATFHYFPGWYTSAVYGKAQLRERTAFALSQILVLSNADNGIRTFPWFSTSYDDLLSNGAFGSYEELLTGVSKHPAMAHYLSHFRNQAEKLDEDGNVIIAPDENYAREVMQLFSIGLIQKHLDGSLKLGADGLPQRTYDQTDITELSRVFTGWANSVQMTDGGLTPSTTPNTTFTYTGRAASGKQYYKPHMTMPMKSFEDNGRPPTDRRYVRYHDNGVKQWLGHTIAAGQTGDQELAFVMDTLSNDPNTAVFVSRQLIQRLVASNPSAGYLYRVSKTFDDTNGDLGEVIKAILLDAEARNLSPASNIGNGKVEEPLLTMVALMRLIKPESSVADTFNFDRLKSYGYPAAQVNRFESNAEILYLNRCLGPCVQTFDQAPLYAATVFNYFLPDFAPPGPIIDSGLVAPELQLLDENNSTGLYNSVHRLVLTSAGLNGSRTEEGGSAAAALYVQPAWMADAYMNVMDANDDGQISSADSTFTDDAKIREASAALVDIADDYLCNGRLQANATGDLLTDAREIIITGVYGALGFQDKRDATRAMTARNDRIRETLYLVTSAPQCTFME